MKLKLMHTMDGRPASYNPGGQICFLTSSRSFPTRLCDSMSQIRRERRLSDKWRKSQGFDVTPWSVGRVFVQVP